MSEAPAPSERRATGPLSPQALDALQQDLARVQARLEDQARELDITKDKLQETVAHKDDFVAKASHELRTPLTSIKEGLSLLLDGALGAINAEQRDFLTTIDSDIDRLTELINAMLDLSKIEAGRMRLLRTAVDLPDLLHALIRSFQPILGRRTVRIDGAAVPSVLGDANRVRQVFVNLLSNALKFTADEGRIVFRLHPWQQGVLVTVEDDGCGIAAHDLSKLFQKFSQVGSAPGGNQPRGSGLGLVVCKELVELHGGRIEVRSVLGQGTTFTIWLPAYDEQQALEAGVREVLRLPADEAGSTAGLVAIQPRAGAEDPRAALGAFAAGLRRLLSRDDLVLPVHGDGWVAVLAHVNADGLASIARRLQETATREGHAWRLGTALHARDGATGAQLLARAVADARQREAGDVPPAQANGGPA